MSQSAADKENRSIEIPPLTTHVVTNEHQLRMELTNFGGKLMSLSVPDREGNFSDIVLGYDSAEQYVSGNPYFGALIGRYGNRIAKGKFSIDGKAYSLDTNNGANALHGGVNGFHNVVWNAKQISTPEGKGVEMKRTSPDGEEGYPGNLDVTVRYILTNNNALKIEYEATTDQPTIINLTHHSFFNLGGAGNGNILGHRLTIFGDQFCPVDEGLIPTGIRAVNGTPFDFTQPHTIGERIDWSDDQLRFGKGYDHNWILQKEKGTLSLAAVVEEPVSGRVMEVWTTEPGLQFYSGNFLDGTDTGKGGKTYPFRSAICLEAQHFPDSPNQKDFPNVILRPGEVYRQTTIYKFTTR